MSSKLQLSILCDVKMYLCINNSWEWDEIRSRTRENGAGTGTTLAGTRWEREKGHGNGTGRAFPCKYLFTSPSKFEIRPFSTAVFSAFHNGSWQLATDSYTRAQYLNLIGPGF